VILLQLAIILVSLISGFFILTRYGLVHKTNERGYTSFDRINLVPTVVAILLPLASFVIAPSFGQVEAGKKGIVLSFGAITGRELEEGLFFITPFVESVVIMDLQVHAETFESAAASKDLQDVATSITVNYRLDSKRITEVYRDLRNDYIQRVMVPANQEAVKAATAQFDAERLIVERGRVKEQILSILSQRLHQHGIIVDGVSITEFKFSPEFSKAIEAKVTATQQALKAENDLRRIKAEAAQKIETAKAGAEAIRIQAQAINSQGGKDYVMLKWVEAWASGGSKVPTYWMGAGGGVVPIFNISKE
jgi:regulator of protease activity HflC (stomatin/prohibitin superfamily)